MRKAKLLMAVTFLLISGTYAQTVTTHPSLVAQTVCQNTPATPLTVSATGAGLTYQWYSNTSTSYVGAIPIPGANAATYTPSTATDGTLYYFCWVIPVSVAGSTQWMSQNLNVDRYRNGDPIPEVSDPGAWQGLTTGAWCHVDGNPGNDAAYGKLYNWYAVTDPRGLAPYGWRVPSDGEFNYEFNDQLAGYRHFKGKYYYVGLHGNWWSNSQESGSAGTGWLRQRSGYGFKRFLDDKRKGMSVRCIKN